MSAQFDDGKEEGALRTIGEVAKALDIKPHVLRYWEQQFPMLDPLKRSGGRRYYRPEDIALVERIDRLVNSEGYTLKGAKKALSGKAISAESESETADVTAPEPSSTVESTETEPVATAASDAGGVGAFFGRPSSEPEADEEPAGGEDPQETAAAAEGEMPEELLAQLKSIRNRLSEAIGA